MDLDRGRKRLLRIALEVPDALGMVLYSVYGAYVALHDCPQPTGPIPAIWLGLVGSCFGSFFVDLLCHVPPRMISVYRDSLYMTPALLASGCYAAWDRFGPPQTQVLGGCVAIVLSFALRMWAFVYQVKLPHWDFEENPWSNRRRLRRHPKKAAAATSPFNVPTPALRDPDES